MHLKFYLKYEMLIKLLTKLIMRNRGSLHLHRNGWQNFSMKMLSLLLTKFREWYIGTRPVQGSFRSSNRTVYHCSDGPACEMENNSSV